MLRLKQHLQSALRAGALLPAPSLHRLSLSTAAAAAAGAAAMPAGFVSAAFFAAGFVAEEYLVAICGLSRAQARKASKSKHLAHLKSQSKPDAALAFFADAGLARAAVATAIARDPQILCLEVGETLNPRVGLLRDIGLSAPQISRLVTIVPRIFTRPPQMISRLAFYLSFLGSYEDLHAALKNNLCLLTKDVERLVRPNIEFLLDCGLTRLDVVILYARAGTLLTMVPEGVKEMVARAVKLGVPRDSRRFKYALEAVCNLTPDAISAKIEFLRTVGCSGAELAVSKHPGILLFSEEKLSRQVEFLKVEVGLEPTYIMHRPALLKFSLQARLMPRHYVIEVLKAKGLVKKDIDFYGVTYLKTKKFVENFLDCHKESVPGLASAFAAARAGKVPPEIKL